MIFITLHLASPEIVKHLFGGGEPAVGVPVVESYGVGPGWANRIRWLWVDGGVRKNPVPLRLI